jgi:hypothetical protein
MFAYCSGVPVLIPPFLEKYPESPGIDSDQFNPLIMAFLLLPYNNGRPRGMYRKRVLYIIMEIIVCRFRSQCKENPGEISWEYFNFFLSADPDSDR